MNSGNYKFPVSHIAQIMLKYFIKLIKFWFFFQHTRSSLLGPSLANILVYSLMSNSENGCPQDCSMVSTCVLQTIFWLHISTVFSWSWWKILKSICYTSILAEVFP